MCLNLRSPGWVRQCPAHARLCMESTAAEAQRCHTCQPCPWLRHSEITADLFEQNPNTISLIHHKIKVCFPIPGTEQWEKTKLASALSLNEGNPSPSLPWGKQLPRALQHTGAASFCSFFFQTFPQPHLPTTADAHWQ